MKNRLPREISSLINCKSHAWGIAYAEQSKQQLVNEIEKMHADGAEVAEIERYLSNRPPCIFATSSKMT